MTKYRTKGVKLFGRDYDKPSEGSEDDSEESRDKKEDDEEPRTTAGFFVRSLRQRGMPRK